MAKKTNDYEKEKKAINQIEEEIFNLILDYGDYSCFIEKSIKLTDIEDNLLYFDVEFTVESYNREDNQVIDFIMKADVISDNLFFAYDSDQDYKEVRCFDSYEFQKMLFFKALER